MKFDERAAVITLSHVGESFRYPKTSAGPAFRRATKKAARRLLMAGLAAGLLLSGCSKKQQNQPASTAAGPAAASTSTPPAQSQAAQNSPQNPSAQAPSGPSQAAPANTAQAVPAPPPPKVYTVPRGTRLEVRVSQTISAKDNNVGDGFRGRLARSVRVGGVTVLRVGAPVSGTVVAAKGQGRFKGAGDLGIALDRVGGQAVTTTAYEKVVKGKGKRSAGFIGGGGGGGALIGGLAGGGKGALIGGLVGAGAGTAGAAFTGNKNVVIPAESIVSFSLTRPVTVTVAPAPASAPQ